MQVHGKCETVITKFRPVPLSWQFCYQREDQARLLPLLARKGRALNPQLQPPPSEKYLGVDWGRYDKLKSAQLQYALHTQSYNRRLTHLLFMEGHMLADDASVHHTWLVKC